MKKTRGLVGAAAAFALCVSLPAAPTFAEDGKKDTRAASASDLGNVTSLKLDKPTTESKPEVRWWLAQGSHTDETIKESVKEIADSGFSGIEFAMLNETNVDASKFSYGSKEWVNDVKLIIAETAKRGLSASFTSGTHWSTANIPGLDPNSEGASHDVGSAHANVQQGSTLTTVPTPTIAAGRTQKLVSAVAYKLDNAYTTTPTIYSPLQLDPATAVDLTEDAKDGTLNFSATDGNYMVFTFWYRGTAQQSSPAIAPAMAINYFDKAGFEALKTYWESYLFADEELVKAIRDNGNVQMFMDSLEFSNSQSGAFGNFSMFWTQDLQQEFKDRKGYDIAPYLPVLIGSPDNWTNEKPVNGTIDFSGTAGKELRQKVVADLRDVQTRLYMDNLLKPLRKWLNEDYGIKLRAQISYGKNVEISMPITEVDYPETETRNQREQTDIYRVHAGGAHLQNKLYSSETAADSGMNYGYSLQEYLQKNYSQYAGGVNRVIWHGYASKYGPKASVKWPGYEAGMNAINGRWGSRLPSSKDYNEYNDHLGRVQTVLRAGKPQVDLAILYSDYSYQLAYGTAAPAKELPELKQQRHEGWQWKDLTLQDNGYTYDYFAPQYLDGGFAEYDKTSGTIGADGPAYNALLAYQETIPLASAQKLLEMAKDGLKVILVKGALTKTLANDGKESELASIRSELLSLTNVRQVANKKAALGALQAMDVEPRVSYGTPDKELLSVTRKDDEASYLFLYNYYNVIKGWDKDFTTFDKTATWDKDKVKNTIEVDGTVKPYLLDTWTGKTTEVANFTHKAGKTIVPIEIPDGDVRVYIFKDTAKPGTHVTATDADKVMLDNGNVSVRSTKTGQTYVQLDNGKRYNVKSDVPKAQTLTGWDVNVETWSEGQLSAPRSETTGQGNYTEEYVIETDKKNVSAKLGNLLPWDDIAGVGKTAAGVGTYETTFQWDTSKASGTYLDLGPLVESATVYVNGKKTDDVNLIDAVVDVPNSMLVNGENKLKIVVTSTLANKMLSLGRNGGNPGSLVEGPRTAGRDRNGNANFRYDQVYTYFQHGLQEAVLKPYVNTKVDTAPPVVKPPVTAPSKVSSKVSFKLSSSSIKAGRNAKATVRVTAKGVKAPTGTFTIRKGSKVLKTVNLRSKDKGKRTFTVPKLPKGKHTLRIVYSGGGKVKAGKSVTRVIRVR